VTGLEAPTKVGSLDVVGTMGNHETRSIAEHGVERSMHGPGGLRIESAGRFIQYHDQRMRQRRTRNRHPLPLTG
jgi:hypothetical protein